MYVYLTEYDGEWAVMDYQEYESTGGNAEYGPYKTCEEMFSLGGHRSHYLSADFITNAESLFDSAMRNNELTLTYDEIRKLIKCYQHAVTYTDHQSGFSGIAQCDPMCSACEFITDDADTVENLLGDHGYVTEWNDGVSVYKVAD